MPTAVHPSLREGTTHHLQPYGAFPFVSRICDLQSPCLILKPRPGSDPDRPPFSVVDFQEIRAMSSPRVKQEPDGKLISNRENRSCCSADSGCSSSQLPRPVPSPLPNWARFQFVLRRVAMDLPLTIILKKNQARLIHHPSDRSPVPFMRPLPRATLSPPMVGSPNYRVDFIVASHPALSPSRALLKTALGRQCWAWAGSIQTLPVPAAVPVGLHLSQAVITVLAPTPLEVLAR